MFSRFSLLAAVLVVLAHSAVQVPAAAVDGRNAFSAASTATVTLVETSYYTGATTSTLLTSKVCASIAANLSPCRRKRQFWLDVPIIISRDEIIDAYIRQQFQPSQVLR